jgi:hypothetical protein
MNTKTGRLIRYLPLSINVYGVGGLIGSITRKTSFLLIRSFLQHEKYAVSSAFAKQFELGFGSNAMVANAVLFSGTSSPCGSPTRMAMKQGRLKVGLVCQILATLVAAVVPI